MTLFDKGFLFVCFFLSFQPVGFNYAIKVDIGSLSHFGLLGQITIDWVAITHIYFLHLWRLGVCDHGASMVELW